MSEDQIWWQQTKVHFEAHVGDPKVFAIFRFRNEGSEPVVFSRLDPSCTCLTAELPHGEFAPGQEGVLVVGFRLGTVAARETQFLRVFIGRPTPCAVLELEANLRSWVQAQPRTVFWNTGETSSEKAVVVTAADDNVIENMRLVGTANGFRARIKDAPASRSATILVKPTSTALRAGAILKWRVELSNGRQVQLATYALIH